MTTTSNNSIIDQWSYLDYKPSFLTGDRRSPWFAPTWVGEDNERRLRAYAILDSYTKNQSRLWLNSADITTDQASERREYGDAEVVIHTIKDSVLGDNFGFTIPEAEGEKPDAAAVAQLELMRKWAKKESFMRKVALNEIASLKFGDSVLVLNWNEEKGRPEVNVWDPGFYFPVLDPTDLGSDFPKKVHIAYEYEGLDTNGNETTFVRRLTWELVDKSLFEDGEFDKKPTKHPWNDKPTSMTCLYTDATWDIKDLEGEVWDLEGAADYMDDETDLGIDFIPVVHYPCTPAGTEHFGVSSLSRVLQILDDIISTDTDLQAASATTGSPPIVLHGTTIDHGVGQVTVYGPGTLLQAGEGGATMIDTSKSLDALTGYSKELRSRFSVNIRIPESLLGRVKPSEVPSGIAITISFAPHTAMVKEMRMVREECHNLALKFVSRLYAANGNPTFTFEPTIIFGSFLPSDKKEVMDLVVQGINSHTISLQTAVTMLMEAGFAIDDAAAEVKRIIVEDVEGAAALRSAGATTDEARKRLGLPPMTDQDREDEGLVTEDDEDDEDTPPAPFLDN